MSELLHLKVRFIRWFESNHPGEGYQLREGGGEWVIICNNGNIVRFSEYYATLLGSKHIIGGLEGEIEAN